MELGQPSPIELDQDELLQGQSSAPDAKVWGRPSLVGAALAGAAVALLCVALLSGGGAVPTAAPPARGPPPALVDKLLQLHGDASRGALGGLAHLRALGDTVPEPHVPDGLSTACETAFKEKIQAIEQKVQQLMVEAMTACMGDPEGDECKAVQMKCENLDQDMKQECETSGELCTVTSTDKEGEQSEKQCIPKACHGDDLATLKTEIEKSTQKLEDKIPECKDFKCTVKFECPA